MNTVHRPAFTSPELQAALDNAREALEGADKARDRISQDIKALEGYLVSLSLPTPFRHSLGKTLVRDDEQNVAHYYLLDNAHKVEDAMTRDPWVVHPGDPIQDAVNLVLKHQIGALPVVGEDRKLVGMISAVDMLRAFHESSAE